MSLLALMLGDYPLTPRQVLAALSGRGDETAAIIKQCVVLMSSFHCPMLKNIKTPEPHAAQQSQHAAEERSNQTDLHASAHLRQRGIERIGEHRRRRANDRFPTEHEGRSRERPQFRSEGLVPLDRLPGLFRGEVDRELVDVQPELSCEFGERLLRQLGLRARLTAGEQRLVVLATCLPCRAAA